MLKFKSTPNPADIVALACDVFMLSIFLLNQLKYGMNMLFLIIPLALIGVIIVLFGIIPKEYCFTENSLEIRHALTKTLTIPCDSVFNYELTTHDSFINIGFNNKVKLYYELKGKKSAIVCRLPDITGFVDALKTRCPELQDETSGSKIDVFFNKKDD